MNLLVPLFALAVPLAAKVARVPLSVWNAVKGTKWKVHHVKKKVKINFIKNKFFNLKILQCLGNYVHHTLYEEESETIVSLSNLWNLSSQESTKNFICENIKRNITLVNACQSIYKLLNLTNIPLNVINIDYFLLIEGDWTGESIKGYVGEVQFLSLSLQAGFSQLCKNSQQFCRLLRLSNEISFDKHPEDTLKFISEGENEEKHWAVFSVNISISTKCQSNAVYNSKEKACKCIDGFYKENINNCTKSGYFDIFCFSCEPCGDFCTNCYNGNTCLECSPNFILEAGTCWTPFGKNIYLLLIYFF